MTSTEPASGVVLPGGVATTAVRAFVLAGGTVTAVAPMQPMVAVGNAPPAWLENSCTPVIVRVSPTRAFGGSTLVIWRPLAASALLTVYVSADPPVRMARNCGISGRP